MIKKCKSIFMNSPFKILFSFVMAVSFLLFPIRSEASAPVTNSDIVFLKTSAYINSVLGGSSSDYTSSSIGSFYAASESSGKISVGSRTMIYIITNKETGEYCYSTSSSTYAFVYLPVVVSNDKLNNDTITSAVKSYIDSQTDALKTHINKQTDSLTGTITDSVESAVSSIQKSINAQTKTLLEAISNISVFDNPIYQQSFPNSTGKSYSNLVRLFNVNDPSTFTISSEGFQNIPGTSFYQGVVNYKLETASFRLPSGSYILDFPQSYYSLTNNIPSVLRDPSKCSVYFGENKTPRKVVLTAFGHSSDQSIYTFYIDCYTDVSSLTSFSFDIYYITSEPVDAFTVTNKTGSILASLFVCDDNKILDSLESMLENNNSNTQDIINNANENTQKEIDAANQNADDIMNSYDSSSQEDKNKEFADSQQELQEAEDNLFSTALEGFDKLDFSQYSLTRFVQMGDSLRFVSSFLQSAYIKMGDFGIIVTVGLVVMIASKIIGLYRFSTGGDRFKGE